MIPRLPWWRAASLEERSGAPLDFDRARATERIALWHQLPAFKRAISEDDVLSPLGIDSRRLEELLGETDDSLRMRLSGSEPSPWYADFVRFWRASLDVGNSSAPSDLGFVEVVRPLLEGALLCFQEEAKKSFSGKVETALLSELMRAIVKDAPLYELSMILGSTCVLEMHVLKKKGELEGNDAEARYGAFLSRLKTLDFQNQFMTEYVELTRVVCTRLDFWVRNRLQLIKHFFDDFHALSILLGGPILHIESVKFGAGDSHRQGKSVGIVGTNEGVLVYKPRAGCLEQHFDELVNWLNRKLPDSKLEGIRSVYAADHLWCEFVEHKPLRGAAGIERYAYQLGKLTALLHCLHATDFHFENVIASGDQPYLVDLEALFHTEPLASTDQQGMRNAAYDFLSESVKKVGILPDRVFMHDVEGSYAIDVSATSGHGGQPGIVSVPTLVNFGTDDMRVENQRPTITDQQNTPRDVHGSVVALLGNKREFCMGFRDTYRVLKEFRDQAMDEAAAPFASCNARFITRPTFLYGRLLLNSFHPNFNRDRLDKLLILGKLLHGHAGRPYRSSMISSELEDMQQGDIPFFEMAIRKGNIMDSLTRTVGFGNQTPLERVRTRLKGLSEEDLSRQLQVCSYSFDAASVDGQHDRWPGWSCNRSFNDEFPAEELRDASLRVGRMLCRNAIKAEGRCGWLGLDLVDERWWTLSPTGLDLYTGSPGILLALSAIGSCTDDAEVVEFAALGLDHLACQMDALADLIEKEDFSGRKGASGLGAFGMLGGPIVALNYASVLYGRADWANAADKLLPGLDKLARSVRAADIVAGHAGAIFLAHIARKSLLAARVSKTCAEQLKHSALDEGGCTAWINSVEGDVPLVGFSHGTLGIASALAIHATSFDDDSLWQLVGGALRYEDRHFNLQTGDSADLRERAQNQRSEMRAWCHGAGGGVVGRLILLGLNGAHIDRTHLKDQVDRAAMALGNTGLSNTSVVSGIGNHSICHGDIGNLIALCEAEGWDNSASTWRTMVESASRTGWYCGVPGGIYTPGLMTGMAGIGWGLAYASSRGALPNVLMLESPHGSWW